MSPSHCNRTPTSIANHLSPQSRLGSKSYSSSCRFTMPQAKSSSNSSCEKRDESQDNSGKSSNPSCSADSPRDSISSLAHSPTGPAKPSPFAAFKLSSTGRPIPFKGRARSKSSCQETPPCSLQSKES